MIICGTGHRPQKLQENWGQYNSLTLPRLTALAKNYFTIKKPNVIISGMALGWDTAIALAALELGIELHCYVPFDGCHIRWTKDSQNTFQKILEQGQVFYPEGEECFRERSFKEVSRLLMSRNTDMLNVSNAVVALWNGDNSGGTADAIKKAKALNIPVDNLWNSWIKYKGF
jgi:uncharacterized phage-like protein YoqJ